MHLVIGSRFAFFRSNCVWGGKNDVQCTWNGVEEEHIMTRLFWKERSTEEARSWLVLRNSMTTMQVGPINCTHRSTFETVIIARLGLLKGWQSGNELDCSGNASKTGAISIARKYEWLHVSIYWSQIDIKNVLEVIWTNAWEVWNSTCSDLPHYVVHSWKRQSGLPYHFHFRHNIQTKPCIMSDVTLSQNHLKVQC